MIPGILSGKLLVLSVINKPIYDIFENSEYFILTYHEDKRIRLWNF